ncbi:MAG: hypothetical protein HQ502_05810 [Alphaproteobacteria bacterium]|nr:hypothetical protein [Alphaproteobacteria bacterium]
MRLHDRKRLVRQRVLYIWKSACSEAGARAATASASLATARRIFEMSRMVRALNRVE